MVLHDVLGIRFLLLSHLSGNKVQIWFCSEYNIVLVFLALPRAT